MFSYRVRDHIELQCGFSGLAFSCVQVKIWGEGSGSGLGLVSDFSFRESSPEDYSLGSLHPWQRNKRACFHVLNYIQFDGCSAPRMAVFRGHCCILPHHSPSHHRSLIMTSITWGSVMTLGRQRTLHKILWSTDHWTIEFLNRWRVWSSGVGSDSSSHKLLMWNCPIFKIV